MARTLRFAPMRRSTADLTLQSPEKRNSPCRNWRSISRDADRANPIPGIYFRAADGGRGAGPPVPVNNDLDALPMPFHAQELFEPSWYDAAGATIIPGGMLASRGCPARCTFCANYVTGRKIRFRSPGNVIGELNAWHARYGNTFFPFWDDALSAQPAHLAGLCEAFERELAFPFRWSAITRANMVTPELLRQMRRAGCVSVNFGVESGDNQILRIIKKGVTTEHVVRALGWAKDEGLATAANFMLGFPQGKTPDALERTLQFMERIAPLVDSFSTLGVVVPFPGTPLYDDHHQVRLHGLVAARGIQPLPARAAHHGFRPVLSTLHRRRKPATGLFHVTLIPYAISFGLSAAFFDSKPNTTCGEWAYCAIQVFSRSPRLRFMRHDRLGSSRHRALLRCVLRKTSALWRS